MWKLVVIGAAVVASGCQRSGPRGAKAADAAVAVAVVATDAAVAAAAAAPVDAAVVLDVPAFAATGGGGDAKKAAELAADAVEAVTRGNDLDPVATALAAVKADPSSPLARYALACVTGDEAFDLAQLRPLAEATGCPGCVEVMRNVATAGECDWSDAVEALGASVKPGPQRAAAEAIVAALSTGDPAGALPYVKAGTVEYFVACSVCDGDEGDRTTRVKGARLITDLARQAREADEKGYGWIVGGGAMTCASDCCDVDVGMLAHSHDFFSRVCFRKGTDQVRRLELVSGG